MKKSRDIPGTVAYNGSQFAKAMFDESTAFNRWCWLAFFVLIVIGAVFETNALPFYFGREQYLYTAIWIAYVLGCLRPIYRLSHQGHRVVLVVVIWSVISLIITLAFLYGAYFRTTANLAIDWAKQIAPGTYPTVDPTRLSAIRAQANLFLTVPPVILGIWAGVTGLYVNYQTTKQNQRTGNAFSLLMQARTSPVFIAYALAKQITYPPDYPVDLADREFFPAARQVEVPSLKHKCEHLQSRLDAAHSMLDESAAGTEQHSSLDAKIARLDESLKATELRYRKLEGIAGIRYLLNYYEFMAKGIRIGDLDEELLRGTLRGGVVSLYRDTQIYRHFIQVGNKNQHQGPIQLPQRLAYEHLTWLVEGDQDGWDGWDDSPK